MNNRKLKIAFFSDMLVRDYDGCMRTIFQLLDRQPEDVELQYFTGNESEAPKGKSITIPDLEIPFNRSYKMALPFLRAKELNLALDAFRPDVIHISSPSALGNFALRYANERGIVVSTIYHTHYLSYVDFYFRDFKALIPLVRKVVAANCRSFYNSCNLILVPTEIMITDLMKIGVKKKLMHLWQRGIDKTIFHPMKKSKAVIKQITNNDKPNVLFASRLVWEKNLETLIKINEINNVTGQQFNLLVAGDGVSKVKLMERMPNTYFLGRLTQEDLSAYYASCDIFLFPSISETFGNVVIEAMSCGTPCIIGNGGGTTSFIEEGLTGHIIEPYNAHAYIAAVRHLLDNPVKRAAMSNACLGYAQFFDWDALVNEFYCLLKQIYALADKVNHKAA